ncbi:MAG: phage holin family protein [Pseudonocardiaceae bacterium]|nr:phage holin family protein [Pseudonocardiaceae bacterium]
MSRVTSAQTPTGNRTDGRHARHADDAPPAVPSIPMSPEADSATGTSLGGLVREASTHLSTLLRSEIELARAEVTDEVRKGVKGSIFFIVALAVLLFSLFFLFFFLGELLSVWLARWAAFGIVFVLMLLTAGLFGLLGYLRVRKIRKPERTMSSVRETAQLASRRGKH